MNPIREYPEQADERSTYPIPDDSSEEGMLAENGQNEPARSSDRRRNVAWEVIETILLALLIFVMVRAVVLNFRVDGSSMEPSLHTEEMLIVNRRAYSTIDVSTMVNWIPGIDRESEGGRYIFSPPERGEIVVFTPPNGQNEPYIKRIIGLPGEEITIQNGLVLVDGQPLMEDYVSSPTAWRGGNPDASLVIPEDHIFVLGDNRSNSSDSRSFGTVPLDDVIGKAWVAYWPPGSTQIVSRPHYDIE